MNKLIKAIEKMKPAFDVIARNRYLKAIKDGFVSAMPIVLFSSIFMLIAYVPNIFEFYCRQRLRLCCSNLTTIPWVFSVW